MASFLQGERSSRVLHCNPAVMLGMPQPQAGSRESMAVQQDDVVRTTLRAPADTGRDRRWLILYLILAITIVNFIDRTALSILAPVLKQTYHFSGVVYGRIISAFQFGMMTGEIPMGFLMDSVGARIGLSLAVLWWSGATGMLAAARSAVHFGGTMFWMGTGECGNYSGGVKTVSRLFDKRNRTLALGIFNSGSMIGNVIAPVLVVYLLKHFGLKTALLVPAVLGLLWIPVWWFVRGHENVDKEIKVGADEKHWRSSSAWALMTLRFFHGPVLQFYWYWLPLYLATQMHMSMTQLGLWVAVPYALGGGGGILGGFVAGVLRNHNMSMLNVRRWTLYGSAVVCILSAAVPYTHNALTAVLVMSIAILAGNFFSGNMYGAITDLIPESQAGRVTGMTGFAGGLSGFLFPLLTGWLVDHISYKPAFAMVAIMPMIGAFGLFAIGRRYYTTPELFLPRDASPPSDPAYMPRH